MLKCSEMTLLKQPLHSRGLGGLLLKGTRQAVLTIFAAEHLETEYAC